MPYRRIGIAEQATNVLMKPLDVAHAAAYEPRLRVAGNLVEQEKPGKLPSLSAVSLIGFPRRSRIDYAADRCAAMPHFEAQHHNGGTFV